MRKDLQRISQKAFNGPTFLHATRYTLRAISCLTLLLTSPLTVLAGDTIKVFATPGKLTFTDLVNKVAVVADTIIAFLVGVALLCVIWGALKYVRSAGDSEKLAEGRKVAVYGIIALFVMLSFWGFVMLIKNSLFG